jgi:hypothetical protein
LYHGLYWYTDKPDVKISIDIDDPVPPFAQLIAQVKTAGPAPPR